MARNERKRQEKLAKKRKARQEQKVQIARVRSGSMAVKASVAAAWPVYEVFRTSQSDVGVHGCYFSRRSPTGEIALAVFVVDRECLGVKDCWMRLVNSGDYNVYMDGARENHGISLQAVSAAFLRKFIEGAVAAAKNWGFSPHADYSATALIFGEVDSSECPDEFEYGRDGKPFYFQGRYEDFKRSREIAKRVHELGGKYVIGLEGLSGLGGRSILNNVEFEERYGDEEDLEDEDDDLIEATAVSAPSTAP